MEERKREQVTPFQILKVKVYPVINNVILKLIDHIVKSQEVEKHEVRLKKKKLLDELERKYIERQIQKQELGSDYQQSDDQDYYKKLEMKKEEVQKLIYKRLNITKYKNSSDPSILNNQLEKLGQNVFNPIKFIIDQLQTYQKLKKEGKLNQFQPKIPKQTISINQSAKELQNIENQQ